METFLGDLNLNWCIIYLHDIFIFLKDLASHLGRLEAVFQNLEQAGLKLKPSKCEMFQQQIPYLGHVVSAQGIATNKSKIEAIKEWPNLTNVTEVWSFLGFTRYYRWFISKFAQVAWPLHELTMGRNVGKKALIVWDDRCQLSFDDLKCLCITAPILVYTDFTRPFKLHTDACGSSLGAVLYQTHDDGMDVVITYASRSLTKAESHYPACKLEYLSLKWAVIEKFHECLYGSAFDVYTDNRPLTYVLMMDKLDTASHCWVARLANYNFQLYYRAGKTNIDADALSRVPWLACMPDTSDTNIQVIAVAVWAMQDAALEGSVSPIKAYSSNVHILDSVEASQQVTCMTTDDWHQVQLADPVLGLVIVRLQEGTLSQCQLKETDSPELQQFLRECNHLKPRWGVLYRKTLLKESQEALFHWCRLCHTPFCRQSSRPYTNCTYILAQTGRNRAPPETNKQKNPMRHPSSCFPERPQGILFD